MGDGSILPVCTTEDVRVPLGIKSLLLKNAWYVPKIVKNLVSIAKLTDDGLDVNFSKHQCKVLANGCPLLHFPKCGHLFEKEIASREKIKRS